MKLQLNNAKSFYCCNVLESGNNNLLIYLANLRKSKIVKICLSFRLQTDVISYKVTLRNVLISFLTIISPIWVLDKQTSNQLSYKKSLRQRERERERERERWQPSPVQSGAHLADAPCATRRSTRTSKCSARIGNLSTEPV